MILRCSQCGGRIDRKDESRFFSCPYCASCLVLEGNRSFACLVMEHRPNELWARAVFLERIRKAGLGKPVGTIRVDLSYHPFWLIRRRDGTVSARPADAELLADLPSVKLPPGRLVFLDEDSRPKEPLVAPTVSLGTALGSEKEESLLRVDLVYLPVYCLRSAASKGERSLLVADSTRLYSTATPVRTHAPYLRPLIFFIVAACFFAGVGLLVDNVYARALTMAVGGLALIIMAPFAIGRPG